MTTKTMILAALASAATAAAMSLAAAPAQAQTAYDVNRLNAAMQICNSPMGAGTPECAKLRGQIGGGGGGLPGGLGLPGGFGGGKAAGIAGLLGGAISAANQRAAASAPQAAPSGGNAQAYASCIQGAGGNPTVIQACAAILPAQSAFPPPAQAYNPMTFNTAAPAAPAAGGYVPQGYAPPAGNAAASAATAAKAAKMLGGLLGH